MKESSINLPKPIIQYAHDDHYPLFNSCQYDYDSDDNGDFAYVVLDRKAKTKTSKESQPIREDVLSSVSNLGRKLLRLINDKKASYDLVIDWCEKYYHPYNLIELMGLINTGLKTDKEKMLFEKVSKFYLDPFINDAIEVFKATQTYIALFYILNGKDKKAYDIDSDIFRMFHNPKTKAISRTGITKEQIGEFNKRNLIYQMIHYDELFEIVPVDQYTDTLITDIKLFDKEKEFPQTPFDEIEDIYHEYLESFPKFTMILQYDDELERPIFVPEINSIIDICYYTLSTFLTISPNPKNMYKNSESNLKPKVLICDFCGDSYVKTGRNQRCCGSEECLRARKNENQKNHRAQKKTTLQ